MTTTDTGRIPLGELARLPSRYFPALSWQRDRLAFYWDTTGELELYVLDLASNELRQVSRGGLPRSLHTGFIWSRAGERIVYAWDKDGNEQHNLVALDVATAALTQLTDDPHCQEYPIAFSPDDTWLLVMTNKVGQLNLWRMRPDGSEYQQLTRYPFPAGGAVWSPDGERIAFVTNESPDLRNQDIYLMNADGSDQRRLLRLSESSRDFVADWSPDGQSLLIGSDVSGVTRAGLFEIETGTVRWLGEEGVEQYAGEFSEDGRSVVCLRNRDAQTEIVVYDVAGGAARELGLPPGVAGFAAFALHDSAIVFSASTPTTRPGLGLYTLGDGRLRTLLAPEYGSIDPALFVDCEYVWYPSEDGTRIPALLYQPRQIEPGAQAPAIIIVHGGPTGQYLRAFDPFPQFLADRGYVVLEPNPRGSTGYGVAFRDAARNDWGGVDLEDIAAGAAYLKALPAVDPARVGVFGGSYGGFMTLLITVKRPELFKAGAAWVGISDLPRLYASSMEHFKYYLREQMGDPEQNAELWRDRSAVNFMESLRARLLIVHGVNDPRCPIEQARVVRDRLLALGRREGEDFEYVEKGAEGHGSTDLDQKTETYRLLADFLARRL
ncbi:MAG TPA: prolyl oligopeptidase family serine peptidase [Dehalococcoidia bacterium]|nr:prolyl oligopeptidase family serine peptidase [Dehalococcoidia bacterium]